MSEKWTKADIFASSYHRGAAVLQEVLNSDYPMAQIYIGLLHLPCFMISYALNI